MDKHGSVCGGTAPLPSWLRGACASGDPFSENCLFMACSSFCNTKLMKMIKDTLVDKYVVTILFPSFDI